MRTLTILTILALVAPGFGTLASARPIEDQEASQASVETSSPAKPAGQILTRLEGWGFEGPGSLNPQGRVTLALNWTVAHESATGRLGWNSTTTIFFQIVRDDAAWADTTPAGVTIERYTGTTTDGRFVLMDFVPENDYVSGYVEAANLNPNDRLAFHVYSTSAQAKISLTGLLETGGHPTTPAASTTAPVLPGLGLPVKVGDGRPVVGMPEARTSGSLLGLGVLTGLGPRALMSMRAASSSGAGSGPSAGPGEGNSGGNSNENDQPPSQPTAPYGPSTLPVNATGLYETSTTDAGDSGAVTVIFDWNDGTTSDAATGPGGGVATQTHLWSQPGTYDIRAIARDSHGKESPWSSTFRVTVTSRNVPDVSPPNETNLPDPDTSDPANGTMPPLQPLPPSASPPFATVGQVVSFTGGTTDTNPQEKNLMYVFSWDDRTTTWMPYWAASGQNVTATHVWTQPGDYRVQIQAHNVENCHKRGGAASSCASLWSKNTTIHIEPVTANSPPTAATTPQGWDTAGYGAESTFTSRVGTDPNGGNVHLEIDWGDGTPTTLSPPVAGGSWVGLKHTWMNGGTHDVRARTVDPHGAASAWSLPSTIRTGNQTQPFEFVILNFTVDKKTPPGADITNTSHLGPILFETGNQVPMRVKIENRGAEHAVVDVAFMDNGHPYRVIPQVIEQGANVTVENTEPVAGLFSTGVHELSVIVAQSVPALAEVNKSNNIRKVDIWVRDPATEDRAYGALYDGKGPLNVDKAQLVAGLYQRTRTGDANSFDEIQQGTSAAMRLLLWSPNFTKVENVTWYFVDGADVQVNAGSGVSFSGAAPTSANVGGNMSEAFPLVIGYSERAGSGTKNVGMAYNVRNGTTLSASSTSLQWHVETNNTPADELHALGFQFTATAASAGSPAVWRSVSFAASVKYTRIDRQSESTLFLWHEVVNASTNPTHPVVSSLEAGSWSAGESISTGDDYNVGDRSMTATPVWGAPADARRTYFDGTSDKAAYDQNQQPSTQSAAYEWIRLDGPLYDSHEIDWLFTGPNGQTIRPPEPYHFIGPADQGEPEGTYVGWAEFRAPLIFSSDLPAEWRGTWTGTVTIDGRPTTTLTFHVLATTTDPKDGPYVVTDEYLASQAGQAIEPVQDADPSNEDLDVLHPTNWKYLNESRIDQSIEGRASDADNLTETLLVDYIKSQANEALNITEDETSGLCTAADVSNECAQVYTLARELVDEAARTPGCTTRTVEVIAASQERTASGLARDKLDGAGVDGSPVLMPADDIVGTASPGEGCIVRSAIMQAWNAVQEIIQPCAGLVTNPPEAQEIVENATNLTAPDLSCLQQTAAAVLNATKIVTALANSTLEKVTSATSLVNMLANKTTGLTGRVLDNSTSAILTTAEPITSLVDDTVSPIVEALPLSPSMVNLNPKFLGDHLGLVYDTVMQTGGDPADAKGSTVSTADSVFYNLRVENQDASQGWTFLDVALSNVTRIDVDNNPATGVDGTDLVIVATLTPSQGSGVAPPTDASRTAPTLRVQALSPAARTTPLLACAFYQLPGVPYVAQNCLDTRTATLQALGVAGPSLGFPDAANMTLSAYSFKTTDPNVTASLRLETQTSQTTLPVVASGTIFQVDLSQHTKPRIVSGNQATAALLSVDGKGTSEFTLRRILGAPAGATSEWTWTTTSATKLVGSYFLARDGRTLVAASNATSPPEQLTLKAARNAPDTTLDVTTQTLSTKTALPAPLGSTTFALTDEPILSLGEAFSLQANALPAVLALHADDASGNVTLATQGGNPVGLRIVSTNQRGSCEAPAGLNVVARHGAGPTAGSCFVLASNGSIQALSVSLASGGPTFTVSSQEDSTAPFQILVDSGAGGTHALDAYLSGTPRSISLQSVLSGKPPSTPLDGLAPPADGSTSLTWTASGQVAHVRALARSGNTILYWNATQVPSSLQASYQWATDAITIRSPTPTGGDLELALTNTGNVPETPAGDFVTATRNGDAIQAAARLTALDHFDTSLAHESFAVTTAASSTNGFGLRYARAQGPAFSLDATSVPEGGFALTTTAQEGGSHTTTYQANAPLESGEVSWVGDFRAEGAHAEGSLASPGALVTVTSTPSRATFNLQTDGTPVGRARVLHAPIGASVTTLEGDDVLHLGNPVDGVDVYRASLGDVSAFSYANQSGALQISADRSAAHRLQSQVDSGESTLYVSTGATMLPSTLRATYSHAGFVSQATGPSGTLNLELHSTTPTEHAHFSAVGLPANAKASWASTPGLTTATITHDAAGLVPSLVAQTATFASGQSTPVDAVNLTLQNVPASVAVSMDASHSEMQLTSTTASGAPAQTGFASFLHANNVPGFSVPNQPQYATMTAPASDATGAQALQLVNAQSMTVRLGHAPGSANRIQILGNSGVNFYTTYTDPSTAASLSANISNVPGQTTLDYTLGSDGANNSNAGGLLLTQTSGGVVTKVDLSATSAGNTPLALDARLTSVPSSWSASWSPNQPLHVATTGGLLGIQTLAVRPVGQDAPTIPTAAQDFATTNGADASQPRFGLKFPAGVSLVHVDAAKGNATVMGTAGRTVDALDQQGTTAQPVLLSLRATSTPSYFAMDTPPARAPTLLAWTANGPTGALTYALDGTTARWRLDASGVPASVRMTLDAPGQTLAVTAPGGIGTLDAKYVNNPTGSFRSDGAGVTFLDHAAGFEEYDPSAESFSVNLPNLAYLSTALPSAGGQAMILQLVRTVGAPSTDGKFTLTGGPNAYTADLSGIPTSLVLTSEPSASGTGVHHALVSNAGLASLLLQARAKEGVTRLEATGVPTRLDLNATMDAQHALHLDYSANAPAQSLGWIINASNVLTTTNATNAPRTFRIDAPTVCSNQTATSGKAWSPTGDTAGSLRFLVANANSLTLVGAEEPAYLVASCAGNDASAHVTGDGFRDAYWSLNPDSNELTASLGAAPAMPQDARIILTGGDKNLILDAVATQLAGGLNVTGNGTSAQTSVLWNSTAGASSAVLFLQAGTTWLNATLVDPALVWLVDAIPTNLNVLHFAGSGATASLKANLSMPNMTASIDALGIPRILDWNFPLHACVTPTTSLHANVTTSGTGTIVHLDSWIIPAASASATNASTPESAILECNGDGMQIGVNLTSFQTVSWVQEPGNVPAMQASASAPSNIFGSLASAASNVGRSVLGFFGMGSPAATPTASTSAATALPSGPVPGVMSVDLQRSPSAPPVENATLQLDTGAQGGILSTIVTAPQVSNTVLVAQEPNGAIRHDFITPAPGSDVNTTYQTAFGWLNETIRGSPSPTSTTFTADGAIDHTGAAQEVRIILSLASGTFVQANLTDGSPQRVTITPGTSVCDGRNTPYTFTADPRGGTIGYLDYYLTDADSASRIVVPGAAGIAMDCTSGAAREIRGLLPDVSELNISSSPCALVATLPTTSLQRLTIPVLTPFFSVNLTHQAYSAEAGLLRMSMVSVLQDDTTIEFHGTDATHARNDIYMATVGLDYRQGPMSTPSTGSLASGACGMMFGDSMVRRLNVTMEKVLAEAVVKIGKDDKGRGLYNVTGEFADAVLADIQLAPPTQKSPPESGCDGGSETPEAPSAPSQPVLLNITASMVIFGPLNVKFHQTPSPLFVPPQVRASTNYVYASVKNDFIGGEANIVGFAAAGAQVDYVPDKSIVDFSARYDGANGPIDVFLDSQAHGDGRGPGIGAIRLKSTSLISGLNFGFSPKDGLKVRADVPSAISEIRASADVRFSCGGMTITPVLIVTNIPAGALDLQVKAQKAGRFIAVSSGGPIGSVDLGVAFGADDKNVVSIGVTNVLLRAEWDFDGDQQHGAGNPYHIFLATDGAELSTIAIRMRFGDWGFGAGLGAVVLGATQARWYFTDFGVLPIPHVRIAGAVCALVPSVVVQVGYKTNWFSIPIKTSPAPGACI